MPNGSASEMMSLAVEPYIDWQAYSQADHVQTQYDCFTVNNWLNVIEKDTKSCSELLDSLIIVLQCMTSNLQQVANDLDKIRNELHNNRYSY